MQRRAPFQQRQFQPRGTGFQPRGNQFRNNRMPIRPRFSYQPRPAIQGSNQLPPYCRFCHISGKPREVYTNHYIGQSSCQSMSERDKQQLMARTSTQLGNVQLEEPDLEAEYGYNSAHSSNDQVNNPISNVVNKSESNLFSDPARCNYIKPVPTQTLTVQDNQGSNVHLDLDTGATVSYAKLEIVLKHGFKIKHNSQLSNLADGKTKMAAVGEIDETFHRNNWTVRFHAIVTKDLHCNFVAGNNFFMENQVVQNISNATINLHKKFNVPETRKTLILPKGLL